MFQWLTTMMVGRLRNERGSVLMLSYLLLISMVVIGGTFIIINASEKNRADVQAKSVQAFYIAEAGLERAIYDIRQEFISGDVSLSNGLNIGGTNYGPDTTAFYDIYPGVTYPSGAYTHAFSSTGNNGYTVSLRNAGGSDSVWVRSTGNVDGVSQTLQVYVRIVNVSPWNNAIFGGTGGSGTMVNGNVNIFGSVHILGNGLDPGDNAVTLGGSAELVGNNYDVGAQGLPSHLKDKIPDLPQVFFGGEWVDTLNAELRVKKGIVSLSGSSTVGQPDSPGDGVKETVDGAYVSDGYGGNKGSTAVYSDNGTNAGYDLGDAVSFPSLDDPHPSEPSQDYYEYFADNALILTTELSDVENGGGSGFTYGDCATNCITKDDSGNLQVEGMVYVTNDNNVSFSNGDFEYTGTGTILVEGDVSIDGDFVTAGDDSFPNNVVGFMTPGNIVLGDSSQKEIMGLFFAETQMSTAFQSEIVGTVITNYFDFTGNVPSIFQVPEAINYLPPGIIANESVWYANIVSWQKCVSHTAVCGGV